MNITAQMVKQLRDKTEAGMMDCKKALVETDGDMEKAITWLRERGIAKAGKKAGRVAAEGLCNVVTSGNKAVLYELNSETDFVAKNEKFTNLVDRIGQILVNSNANNTEEALKIVQADLKIHKQKTDNELKEFSQETIFKKIDNFFATNTAQRKAIDLNMAQTNQQLSSIKTNASRK